MKYIFLKLTANLYLRINGLFHATKYIDLFLSTLKNQVIKFNKLLHYFSGENPFSELINYNNNAKQAVLLLHPVLCVCNFRLHLYDLQFVLHEQSVMTVNLDEVLILDVLEPYGTRRQPWKNDA